MCLKGYDENSNDEIVIFKWDVMSVCTLCNGSVWSILFVANT